MITYRTHELSKIPLKITTYIQVSPESSTVLISTIHDQKETSKMFADSSAKVKMVLHKWMKARGTKRKFRATTEVSPVFKHL